MNNKLKQIVLANLKSEAWNTLPKSKYEIPSTRNPAINAARAIAVCAYPDVKYHKKNGKAVKYSTALLAREIRYSKQLGRIDRLPVWAKEMRSEAMERLLLSGHRNLMKAFTIRDLINSAQIMQMQRNDRLQGRRSTFAMHYSEDLSGIEINVPIEKTADGYILSGSIPDTKLASLRAAILYHQAALRPFQGPAVTADGRDQEYDYQNVYTRSIRPALFAQHIVQVVWEAATDLADEAVERDISIDEILMLKPEWASDIYSKTNSGIGLAIHNTRNLGVACCWCEMLRFANSLHDS